MILVKQNNDWSVYFNPNSQTYSVYRNDKFIIGNKYRFRDVKSYVE